MLTVDPDERTLNTVHRNHPFAFILSSHPRRLIIFYGYSIAGILGNVNCFLKKIKINIVHIFKIRNLQNLLDFTGYPG